jgi:amidase
LIVRPSAAALLITLPLWGLASGAAAPDPPFNPANATIEQLEAALDAHHVTSEQLVRYYLSRMEQFNRRGPHINAVITQNPKALEEAARLDAARAAGVAHGALYGIPFLAKDNFDTTGMTTTGGSAALRHSVPRANAFVLQRLLDQGAILLGKTNMSELAASYGRMGYSSAGGLTLNPYNTARDASGSSSGSAAAVAADFAAFALGTDTSGSIRGPASVAGLVGLRPTLGLTSRSHVIPLSLTVDTTGALARNVRDLAIVLDVMAAPDSGDASTRSQPPHRPGYLDGLGSVQALRGTRFGVVTNFRGGNAEVDAAEQAALRTLKDQGAILVPVTLPAAFEQLWQTVLGPVGEAEFRPQFERYLRSLPEGQPRTLGKLIEISESPAIADSSSPVNPARLAAYRQADATELTDSAAYIRILTDTIPSVRLQLETLLHDQHLDALVFSTMSCPATPRYDRPDPTYVCRSDDPYSASYIAAAAGFPEVTVPAGHISANLPVGLSFMSLPYTEAKLLNLANAFELATPRLPPPPLR